MTRHSALLTLLAVWLFSLTAAPSAAQVPRREPTPNDTLVSPEVASDRRVTFRIYAPRASEVTLRGDWMTGPDVLRMTRDERGVWSGTTSALTPDYYSYSFMVDGVRIVDPKNPAVKQGISSLDSVFFVPGPEAAFQQERAVPHGEIRRVWYSSSTLGTQRRMHLYTPPGYDRSRERYPVLYLLHGGGDEDSGWSTIGRAGFIMDNLLADKKARPMLIVMPNGSLPRPTNLPPPMPGTPPSPAVMAALQDRFTNELLKDVVPFVEQNYRVLTGRKNRAIAGLSMGGGQTLRVVTASPETFGYAAIWSAGIGAQNAADWEQRNAAFLGKRDQVNRQMSLLAITVGDQDFALTGSRALADVLKRSGIKHELQVTGGGHTWINWRRYLNDLAPRLFRENGADRD